MRYTRRQGDMEYRRVMLSRTDVPEYSKFSVDGQSVDYADDAVLEIRCMDGTEYLVYDNQGSKLAVTVSRKDNDKNLPGTCQYLVTVPASHAARLYIQDEHGMEYKIPGALPAYKGSTGLLANTCCFLMPKNMGELRIVGDKYFNKVYNVSMD